MKSSLLGNTLKALLVSTIGILNFIVIGFTCIVMCIFIFIAMMIVPSEYTNTYVREPQELAVTLEKFFNSQCGLETDVQVDPNTVSKGSILQVSNSHDGASSEVVTFATNNFISGEAEIRLYGTAEADEVIAINGVDVEEFSCN